MGSNDYLKHLFLQENLEKQQEKKNQEESRKGICREKNKNSIEDKCINYGSYKMERKLACIKEIECVAYDFFRSVIEYRESKLSLENFNY